MQDKLNIKCVLLNGMTCPCSCPLTRTDSIAPLKMLLVQVNRSARKKTDKIDAYAVAARFEPRDKRVLGTRRHTDRDNEYYCSYLLATRLANKSKKLRQCESRIK